MTDTEMAQKTPADVHGLDENQYNKQGCCTGLQTATALFFGDSLKVLRGFAPGTFDAVITDPPYASGGRTQAEKNKPTRSKYSSMGDNAPPDFAGDSMDQRSWTNWAANSWPSNRASC